MRVLVVIPAYNEEASLGSLLAEARQVFDAATGDAAPAASRGDEYTLMVVDDGSRDGTHRVARGAQVRLLKLRVNLGIGGAVQSGLHVAYREGYDCAVQLDGDGQHPPGELPALIERMRAPDAPDLLIGSRFLVREGREGREGGEGYRSTFLRRVGIGWLRLLLRVVAGARLTDPTSGFRVYGRRALQLFDETYPYDFPEPESIAVARAVGLSAREAPVRMRERQGGISSIAGLSAAGYYMVKVTIAVLLAYVRNRRRDFWRAGT